MSVVTRARAAVGTPFRLHGRSIDDGLDCVGLAAFALGLDEVATGYAMRRGDADRVASLIAATGLTRVEDERDGDLLMLRSGPGQLHLAIKVPGGMVHADAGLRRVVERPGTPPWGVLARFRVES